jgi:hypothetical protein
LDRNLSSDRWINSPHAFSHSNLPVILKKDTLAAEINADVAELVDAQDLGSCA